MAHNKPLSYEEFKAQHMRPSTSRASQPPSSSEGPRAPANTSSTSSMAATVPPSSNNTNILPWPSHTVPRSNDNPPPYSTMLPPVSVSSGPVTDSTIETMDAGSNDSTKKQKQKKNKRVPFEYWRDPAPNTIAPPVHTTSDSAQGRGWRNQNTQSANQGPSHAPSLSSRNSQGRGWNNSATQGANQPANRSRQPWRKHGNRQQTGFGPSNSSANQANGVDNLALAMQNLSIGQTPELPPLTKFELFPDLPPELRIKVFGIVYSMARLLEVSWDIAANADHGGHHFYHRLAPKSCRAPALMQVNHEAREEGKRYYRLVDFTTIPTQVTSPFDYPKKGPVPTWYNHIADVVLFGDNTCMRTIVVFFKQQRLRQTPINQVAVLLSGKVLNCCDWDQDDILTGLPDEVEIDYGNAIGGGCTIMQALHGIGQDRALTDMASGVKGLKEVFFIVPTFLTPVKPGTIDDCIWFRPASGDGTTDGQVKIKRRIESQVQHVQSGLPLPHCGNLDNWTRNERIVSSESAEQESTADSGKKENSEDKPKKPDEHHNANPLDNRPPTFHFVSYTPAANAGDLYDAMDISETDLSKLSHNHWAFMRKIERETKVHLKVPDRDFPGQVTREIGFFGKPEGVARAKEMIEERLIALEGKETRAGRRGYRTPGPVDYFGRGHRRATCAEEY